MTRKCWTNLNILGVFYRFVSTNQLLTIKGGPALIDNIQAHGSGGLVNVGMENFVHEADGWRLEIRDLHGFFK
jgi:hypothetical protein